LSGKFIRIWGGGNNPVALLDLDTLDERWRAGGPLAGLISAPGPLPAAPQSKHPSVTFVWPNTTFCVGSSKVRSMQFVRMRQITSTDAPSRCLRKKSR